MWGDVGRCAGEMTCAPIHSSWEAARWTYGRYRGDIGEMYGRYGGHGRQHGVDRRARHAGEEDEAVPVGEMGEMGDMGDIWETYGRQRRTRPYLVARLTSGDLG